MRKIIGLGLFILIGSTGVNAKPIEDLSATLEYTHSNIDFDIGLESKFNGAVIGFSTSPKEHGYWGKFEYSRDSKSESNYYEGTVGLHYSFLNKDGFYLNGLAGMGYTRLESGITDSNLNFISIPVGVEAGYSFTKHLDLFANVGYKWLFDMTGKNGYFGNGARSTYSDNNDPDKYPDKVVCNNGYWYEGTSPSLCNEHGGMVATEYNKTLCNDGQWREGAINSGTCTASGGILEDKIKDASLSTLRARLGNSASFGDAETPMFKIGLRFRF